MDFGQEREDFAQFRFVKLDYIPVYSLEQMVETFEREVICEFSQIFVSFSLTFWYTHYMTLCRK